MHRTAILTVLCLCIIASAAHAVGYQVTNLGRTPGFDSCILNNFGQFLLTGPQPYIWDSSHGLQDISAGGLEATALRDDGTVLGFRAVGDLNTHAVVRDPVSGQLTDLALPAGAPYTIAWGINKNGEISGTAETADSSLPVLWHADGTPEYLDTTAGLWASPRAYLNDSGEVVWSVKDRPYGTNDYDSIQGYRWDSANGARPLPKLNPTDNWVEPYSINNQGQIFGISGQLNWLSLTHYVLWNPDGTVVDCGVVFSVLDEVSINGLNNRGQLAGDLDRIATIWNPDGITTSLPNLTGAVWATALAINDPGQVVGVTELADRNTYLTLWTPVPEPSSLVALVAGVGGVGVLLRRRLR